MTSAQRIASLERALEDSERRNALLEARLRAEGVDPGADIPLWAKPLSRCQIALMEGLLKAYPRYIDRWALEDLIPRRDHATDRDVKVVDVMVSKVRRALGHDVIENQWGVGWRCSPDFHRQYGATQ